MARPNDARWVYALNEDKVHMARPSAEKTLCGVFVGRDYEGLKPSFDEHAHCDCIVLDLSERGEIRLVKRTRMQLPQL